MKKGLRLCMSMTKDIHSTLLETRVEWLSLQKGNIKSIVLRIRYYKVLKSHLSTVPFEGWATGEATSVKSSFRNKYANSSLKNRG